VPLYHGILPPDSLFGFGALEAGAGAFNLRRWGGPTDRAPYVIGAGR